MAKKDSRGKTAAFAEFFAGVGLMRMGLERAGWRCAFAHDIDANKRALYDAQFGDADAHYMLGDIHELDARTVPDVALATASFPCTDLSLAGARRGLNSGQSSAFWGFVRVLRDMDARRPSLLLIENVPGFLTSHGGRDFVAAMRALNELGYAVDPFIVDAAYFVPQSRQRLFIVGAQECGTASLGCASLNADAENESRPAALLSIIKKQPEIHWCLRNLPPLPECKRTLRDVIEALPPDDAQWWSEERTRYLLSQMSERHRAQTEAMTAGADWSYGTIFRRVRKGRTMAELRVDGRAGCLRTPKGGSARQILLMAGRGQCKVRLLTARECARLMGANDFPCGASLNQMLFAFGDAVCVPVVEWIARNRLIQETEIKTE
ncbi:DNA (cytosine-5-)-methyltransferase [Candidatus Sumerlaeota bacterium]|nr:DNA (cytosine-5-)-methyltransferase [Candidatus Sumerlaeota bacterium]